MMEDGLVAVLPICGSLFAFPLTGFFPGHLNHMSNKLGKKGASNSQCSMGLWGRGKSSWASRKTREIAFMFWLDNYRIVALLENNCCSMVDHEQEQEHEHASMTRNCRSKNVEACSLATSQAGESGKCKIIKPLLGFRETRTCFQQLLCHETPHPSFLSPQQQHQYRV